VELTELEREQKHLLEHRTKCLQHSPLELAAGSEKRRYIGQDRCPLRQDCAVLKSRVSACQECARGLESLALSNHRGKDEEQTVVLRDVSRAV